MNDTQIASLFIIILAIVALYLDSQNKLVPISKEITSNTDTGISISKLILGLVLLLIVLSFTDKRTGLIIVSILTLGALLTDYKRRGDENIISLLFNSNHVLVTTKKGK